MLLTWTTSACVEKLGQPRVLEREITSRLRKSYFEPLRNRRTAHGGSQMNILQDAQNGGLLTRPTPAVTSPARPEVAKTTSSPKDAPFRGQGRSSEADPCFTLLWSEAGGLFYKHPARAIRRAQASGGDCVGSLVVRERLTLRRVESLDVAVAGPHASSSSDRRMIAGSCSTGIRKWTDLLELMRARLSVKRCQG